MDKKLYVVDYTTKCKRGSRDGRKLVETADIEAYIKSNFVFGYSLFRRDKMFISATEVKKLSGDRYVRLEGGTYWYSHAITLTESELKSSIQKASAGSYYDRYLKEYLTSVDNLQD